MAVDLTDAERRALADLLKRAIEADHYPLSPRVRNDEIEPPRVYALPRAGRWRRG